MRAATIPRGSLKPSGQLYVERTTAHGAVEERGRLSAPSTLNGKSIEQRPLMVMETSRRGGFFSRMWDFVLMKPISGLAVGSRKITRCRGVRYRIRLRAVTIRVICCALA